MNWNRFRIPFLLFIGLVLFCSLFIIKVPYTLRLTGQCWPRTVWILQRESDGSLHTLSHNYEKGITESYAAYKLSRGDVFQFHVDSTLLKTSQISMGDTVGNLFSRDLYDRLIQMKDQLRVARASLDMDIAGSKQSNIDEARAKYNLAKKQAAFERRVAQRQDSLFQRTLISNEDYETAVTSAQLAEIEADIAKANLEAAETGVKPQQVVLLYSHIEAIENEIRLLQQRLERLVIRSPISGYLQRSAGADTIMTIWEDRFIALIPVFVTMLDELKEGQPIEIRVERSSEKIPGVIAYIENDLYTFRNKQTALAVARLNENTTNIRPKSLCQCRVSLGKRTVAALLAQRARTLFQ